MSLDLERTISFTEECRWRFPELTAEADRLAEGAIALFGKTVRSMQTVRSLQEVAREPDGPHGPCTRGRSAGTMPT